MRIPINVTDFIMLLIAVLYISTPWMVWSIAYLWYIVQREHINQLNKDNNNNSEV